MFRRHFRAESLRLVSGLESQGHVLASMRLALDAEYASCIADRDRQPPLVINHQAIVTDHRLQEMVPGNVQSDRERGRRAAAELQVDKLFTNSLPIDC